MLQAMKSPPWMCAAVALLVADARAQTTLSADETAVWRMEAAWTQAYLAGDSGAMAECKSPNYVFTDSDGRVQSRAEELAKPPAPPIHFTDFSLHEATARITGDTAVVTGRLVVAGEMKVKFGEIDETTDTLVRDRGGWKAVARTVVRLLPTPRTAVAPLWRDGGDWLQRHAAFAAQAKRGGVDLLFVGDSITDAWRTRGQAVWAARYGRLHAANIGIGGDRTQHVLWRLDHGEVEGLHPKVVVLMIGTNNTGFERDGFTRRNTPAEAAEGVKAVVDDLRQKLPAARILLLAVFPRSHLPTDPARGEVAAINQRIAGLDDGSHVRYLDIGPKFLTPEGVLEPEIMPDFLHPSPHGYELWAQAMQPTLDELLANGR